MSQARIFQCPNCREYIATDAKTCRFCSTPIDATSAQSAADAQAIENKRYRQKQYARHMLIGGGLFALGLLITVLTFLIAASSERALCDYLRAHAIRRRRFLVRLRWLAR